MLRASERRVLWVITAPSECQDGGRGRRRGRRGKQGGYITSYVCHQQVPFRGAPSGLTHALERYRRALLQPGVYAPHRVARCRRPHNSVGCHRRSRAPTPPATVRSARGLWPRDTLKLRPPEGGRSGAGAEKGREMTVGRGGRRSTRREGGGAGDDDRLQPPPGDPSALAGREAGRHRTTSSPSPIPHPYLSHTSPARRAEASARSPTAASGVRNCSPASAGAVRTVAASRPRTIFPRRPL